MKASLAVLIPILAGAIVADAAAGPTSTRVGGYFCETTEDQVAFLNRLAAGDNDILAANAVNKAAGRQSCADYISVDVVPSGERVVMKNGVVYKMYSVVFLPENKERWTGRILDTLDVVAQKQDI